MIREKRDENKKIKKENEKRATKNKNKRTTMIEITPE